MEKLYFKVEGEFVCELARTMFWDDNRPYEASEELLLSCLGTSEITMAEKKQIVQSIIEGRKKLVGVNCFDLIDDGENVRPITLKITKLQEKLDLKQIEEDMSIHPLLYVDPYSTVKSIRAAEDHYTILSYDDAYNYFCFNEFDYHRLDEFPAYQSETMCGLWLLQEPDLVMRANKGPRAYHDETFWERIYEQIKTRKGSFTERNERYLGSLRIKESRRSERLAREKESEQLASDCVEQILNSNKNSQEDLIDKMSYGEYAAYLKEEEPGRLDYNVNPDDINKFEGLIDKNGDFYSCEFGGHNIKAYHIMITYWDQFDFKELIGEEIHSRMEAWIALYSDKALDTITKAGWMATRYLPTIGCYLSYDTDNIMFHATKAQKDTIWEALTKHECRLNDYSLIL